MRCDRNSKSIHMCIASFLHSLCWISDHYKYMFVALLDLFLIKLSFDDCRRRSQRKHRNCSWNSTAWIVRKATKQIRQTDHDRPTLTGAVCKKAYAWWSHRQCSWAVIRRRRERFWIHRWRYNEQLSLHRKLSRLAKRWPRRLPSSQPTTISRRMFLELTRLLSN